MPQCLFSCLTSAGNLPEKNIFLSFSWSPLPARHDREAVRSSPAARLSHCFTTQRSEVQVLLQPTNIIFVIPAWGYWLAGSLVLERNESELNQKMITWLISEIHKDWLRWESGWRGGKSDPARETMSFQNSSVQCAFCKGIWIYCCVILLPSFGREGWFYLCPNGMMWQNVQSFQTMKLCSVTGWFTFSCK